MRKNFKRIFFISIFCIFISLLSFSSISNAALNIGDITLDPKSPPIKSDVTFTVDISGDSVTSVRLVLNECNKPLKICHAPPQNVSLNWKNGDTYEGDITLMWDDVTSITYHLEIEREGKWIEYDEFVTQLSTGSGNGDGSKDSNDSDDSPGFEIIIFIIAILSIILAFKRYKLK